MKTSVRWLALVVVLASLPGRAGEPDPRVRTLLGQLQRTQEVKMDCEVDQDGDYTVRFAFEDGRKQTVILESATSQLGPMEIRQMYSFALLSRQALPAAQMERLLTASRDLTVGSWEIDRADDVRAVILTYKLPATADPLVWYAAMKALAIATDKMEEELNPGKDVF